MFSRKKINQCKNNANDEPVKNDVTKEVCAADKNADEFALPQVVGEPIYAFEPRFIDWLDLREKFSQRIDTSYRPDTIIDGWRTDDFIVRGVTLRGYDHRYYGVPRQDDFAIEVLDNGWIVAAVADGVSSAALSHIAASLVVRYVVEFVSVYQVDRLEDVNSLWQDIFSGAAWTLVERARSALSDENACSEDAEKLMATTLACAVIAPSDTSGASACIAAVGDTGIWTVDSASFEKILGGKASSAEGISSSAVSGLPRVPDEVPSAIIRITEDQALLLGSDGFGDPLGTGDGELGALFRNCLFPDIPSMLNFAHTLDFSRATFDDDRTLVAIWPRKKEPRNESEPSQPSNSIL